MKIKFKEPIQLEVVTALIPISEEPIFEDVDFLLGDIENVILLEFNEEFKTTAIQFGDGTIAFGVPNTVFEIVEFD